MPDTPIQPQHGSHLMPSFEHATVADAMHPGILSCDPDATPSEAARMMATHHVHCLAVVGISHREPECAVWGIVSDHDLLRAAARGETDGTVAALATEPLVSIAPITPLAAAASLMASQNTSHLVVVEPETERPVGIISTLDVAGVLAWGEA